jgi:hypothetical protein
MVVRVPRRRQVADGLPADVVSLALASDIPSLETTGLIEPWLAAGIAIQFHPLCLNHRLSRAIWQSQEH